MSTKTFEDRLLDELLREVALASGDRPQPVRRRVTLRRTALALAACAAAAVTVVLLPGGGATAAYAVEKNADGTVTVTGEEFGDPQQLQDDLRAAGLDATVDRLVDDQGTCMREGPAMEQVLKDTGKVVSWLNGSGDGVHLRIDPSKLKPGQRIQVDINKYTGVMRVNGTKTGEVRAMTHLEVYVAGEQPLPVPQKLVWDGKAAHGKTRSVDCAVE
ncbi:hypothetical protein OG607_23865 [Streptomyces sp. NBC_01537]|uniref:hypothetical protein n=1 Tax=Streptomyces sp. NBC_01537 TaxID=2903896 RepID=UPI0038636955